VDISDRLPAVVVSPVFVNGTAVLRAFAGRSAKCVAVSSRRDVPGFATRAAAEKVYLPEMESRGNALTEWLLSRGDLRGALVIPTGDEIIAELDANRAVLADKFRLCIPSHDVCEIALDKMKLAEAAEAAGVPAPGTVLWRGEGGVAGSPFDFPVLVKPCYCITFSRAFGRKAILAKDDEELRAVLDKCREHSIAVVVQEFLPGDTAVASYNAYVRRSGEIAGDFTTLRSAMFPPVTGTGFMEVAQPIEPVLEYGRRLLESLSYGGALVNMDFKIAANGQWQLLDLNARSWRQVSLAKLIGVDVLEHLLRDYLDRPALANGPVKDGRCWFYIKDALLMSRAYPNEAPSMARYLGLACSKVSYGLLELRDFRPFLEDIKPLLIRRIRKGAPRHIDQ
jgi:predicted ATP-grasp superfamily ATP-dependent carboligase